MQENENPSLEQMRAFLEASEEVHFHAEGRADIYAWVERTLRQQNYSKLSRADKGQVHRYAMKMTGRSRAQVTRMIGQFGKTQAVRVTPYRRRQFARIYTTADVALLMEVDQAHGRLNGGATRWILKRLHRFWAGAIRAVGEHLDGAPVQSAQQRRLSEATHRLHGHPSHARQYWRAAQAGAQRQTWFYPHRHRPPGRLGWSQKGVYHINAVDEVTQWQVMGSTKHISEAWLLPVLSAILAQFPFQVRGFHSDNGSEFINHTVAKLLNKLLIEQTKSRPRRSNDNGLVEAKNGAVVRKHMGYLHIQAEHTTAIHDFFRDHLNPYVNFHRPCGQVKITTDAKGKEKTSYPKYATPWEVFRQIPDAATYLCPGQTIAALEAIALRVSDTEAARRMQQAKHELFRSFYPEARHA